MGAADTLPTLLTVSDLRVSYHGERQAEVAVRDLSFTIGVGETLGLVGESGSGKTQTALALMGLLPETARLAGCATLGEADLLALPEHELNRLRGNTLAMIFQDPMTALNPHLTVGKQMARVLEHHQGLSTRDARTAAATMLERVRVPEARARLDQYPYQLSGGMRQRVMIATALLCRPALLIADEPTTALDVTVQAQILALLRELQTELDTAILFITHDMGVVAANCDRVLVLRDGAQRECGNVEQVFYTPRDTYTGELLAAVPRLDTAPEHRLSEAVDGAALLSAKDVQVKFAAGRDGLVGPRRWLKAVDGVSFQLRAGETLGVVGESGCGKSTLARAVLQLLDHCSGHVSLLGHDLTRLNAAELKARRADMQVVFQDPLAALNPRMTVGEIVAEPLRTFRPELTAAERQQRVQVLLQKVGLEANHSGRYPHEFSGGQCQRVGIARALICQPRLLICDEPVSALDVSVQAQVIDLLTALQRELGLALVFIAHDLAVVKHISHRVMVMYLGRVVEIAPAEALYAHPRHPYTQALISAVPIPDPVLERSRGHRLLEGEIPSPLSPPAGCAFHTRCPRADQRCSIERPALRTLGAGKVACHYADGEQQ